MSPEDIEALIRLLDDPRLGTLAEAQLVEAGAVAIPSLYAYADLAPTIANQLLKQIQATTQDLAWARLLGAPDAEEGAFLLAESLDPFYDRAVHRQQLDALAEPLRDTVPDADGSAQAGALALRDWLHYARRFRANRGDYYAPDNLLLPRLLETRLGVPITLALLYLLVGRRLGAPLALVALPHHPVVRYGEGANVLYIDPFYDGVLMSEEECRSAVQRFGAPIRASTFLPMSDYDIIEQLLRSMAAAYMKRGEQIAQRQIERYRDIWRSQAP